MTQNKHQEEDYDKSETEVRCQCGVNMTFDSLTKAGFFSILHLEEHPTHSIIMNQKLVKAVVCMALRVLPIGMLAALGMFGGHFDLNMQYD